MTIKQPSVTDDYAQKELEIAIFISRFGVSYTEVIGRTFFKSTQSARNFITKMKKKKIIYLKLTGKSTPKYCIALTQKTKRVLEKLGYIAKKPNLSIRVLSHNMIEQIAYFWLGKLGAIERKSVYHHKNVYYSVPDLVLRTEALKIFVEIEIHQKSRKMYNNFVVRASSDKPDRVLYIFENKRIMKTIANAMPTWDKLSYIDIDTMIKNIKEQGKIRPLSQKTVLLK